MKHPSTVLSDKLLSIMCNSEEKEMELIEEVSPQVHKYIDTIISGLVQTKMAGRSYEMDVEFEYKSKYGQLHKPNIVGMTSQVLEKIFLQHKEQ